MIFLWKAFCEWIISWRTVAKAFTRKNNLIIFFLVYFSGQRGLHGPRARNVPRHPQSHDPKLPVGTGADLRGATPEIYLQKFLLHVRAFPRHSPQLAGRQVVRWGIRFHRGQTGKVGFKQQKSEVRRIIQNRWTKYFGGEKSCLNFKRLGFC